MKCNCAQIFIFLCSAALLAAASFTVAQIPAGEHASHHPQQTVPAAATDSGNGMGKPGGTTSGMRGGMGEMMRDMGMPPEKELYPSLMQLPDLSPEKRATINQLANQRISQGNKLLSAGLQELRHAAGSQDFAGIQQANEQIRRGQALVQSGLAAQKALAEHKDPRKTALQWFRQEMNLAPPPQVEQANGFIGLSWFHYMIMLLFAAFAAAMIWMYYHKMKRAKALVARLAGNSADNVPLPAASPPYPIPVAALAEPVPAINPDIAPSKSNSWSGTLYVAEIFDETPNVKTFRLTDPASGKLPFTYLPGQFITVTIVSNGVPVKRSYTIASSPTRRDYCEVTVKHEAKGTVSHYLHTQVHEGELLQLTGPSGKFTFTETHADSAVFIAGGVGVTPMMSAIRYLTDRSWKGAIFFFYTCKGEENIIFREEIAYLQKRHPDLHVCILLEEPGSNPADGFVTGRISKEILNERVPEIASRMIHICGPPAMMNAVKGMLDELKVPKENVMVEAFAGPPSDPKGSLPAAEEAGNLPSGDETRKTWVVTFAKSNKTAVLPPGRTILEASEEVGVNIDYSCRVGTCGICKTRLLSGMVTMEVEDALSNGDKAQGLILACQARATEDVSVEA